MIWQQLHYLLKTKQQLRLVQLGKIGTESGKTILDKDHPWNIFCILDKTVSSSICGLPSMLFVLKDTSHSRRRLCKHGSEKFKHMACRSFILPHWEVSGTRQHLVIERSRQSGKECKAPFLTANHHAAPWKWVYIISDLSQIKFWKFTQTPEAQKYIHTYMRKFNRGRWVEQNVLYCLFLTTFPSFWYITKVIERAEDRQ